jgi:hypothetical protein
MKVVPIRWHSARRQEQVRIALEAVAKEWLVEWAVERTDLVLDIGNGRAALGSDAWMDAGADGASLVAGCREPTLSTLGCLLAGVPTRHGDGVGSAVGRRALADLAQMIFIRVGRQPATQWMSFVHDTQCNARHGVIALRLSLDDVELALFVNDRLCDLLVPPARSSTRALATRFAALQGQQVQMDATLALGKLNLADFRQLRPGQVLKTQARLDALAQLLHHGSQPIAAGTFVRSEGRRALRVESTTMTRGQ